MLFKIQMLSTKLAWETSTELISEKLIVPQKKTFSVSSPPLSTSHWQKQLAFRNCNILISQIAFSPLFAVLYPISASYSTTPSHFLLLSSLPSPQRLYLKLLVNRPNSFPRQTKEHLRDSFNGLQRIEDFELSQTFSRNSTILILLSFCLPSHRFVQTSNWFSYRGKKLFSSTITKTVRQSVEALKLLWTIFGAFTIPQLQKGYNFLWTTSFNENLAFERCICAAFDELLCLSTSKSYPDPANFFSTKIRYFCWSAEASL